MIILDTHIWIRWVRGSLDMLTPAVVELIESEAEVGISVVSCLEVARLARSGRLDLQMDVRPWIHSALDGAGIASLPITPEIAVRSTELAPHHKDPADRLIIATTIVHDATLISRDATFPRYAEIQGRLITGAET